MKKLLLSAAGTLALIVPAAAADIGVEPTYVEPPAYVAEAFSWSGPYIGLHGGWGWANGDAKYAGDTELNESCEVESPVGCAVALDPDGAFVGGQLGWNWQFGNGLVLGIEGDYAFASLHDSGSSGLGQFNTHVDLEIDQIASVRGRVGWAMGQWLPFVTAGWGWAHAEREIFNSFGPITGSDSNWHDGWTAGAGLEYAINKNWSVKGEYRYYSLSEENYSVPTLGGEGTDVELDLHTVSFGVNLRFN